MWSHSEDWNYAHFFSPVNVIPTFMHVYYEAGQLKISCACQHIWAEYAQWWGNFSWFAWRLTSSSCNPLTLGKRSPLPTLLSPCQIYTQIHFQVAGLHTDRHCVYFVQYKNWKKITHEDLEGLGRHVPSWLCGLAGKEATDSKCWIQFLFHSLIQQWPEAGQLLNAYSWSR